MSTLGQKNNNPGNVKSQRWKGEIGKDAVGHAIFKDVPHGIRAMTRTLAQKYNNGKDTILKVIGGTTDYTGDGVPDDGWASAGDTLGSLPGQPHNNPKEYADFIGRRVRISAQEKIDPGFRLQVLIGAILAMSAYENAGWVPKPKDILSGVLMYLDDFVEDV